MSYMGPDIPQGNLPPNSIPAGALQAGAVAWANLGGDVQGAFGFRNRIINGDCRVQQRPALVAANNQGGYGGPDRFNCSNSGAGGQFTQQSNTITVGGIAKPCVAHIVSSPVADLSAGKYWFGIYQLIEGYNCYDLLGQPFAVSFIFCSNVVGRFSLCLRDSASAYSYVTTFDNPVSNIPIVVKALIPAMPLAAVIPCNNTVGMSVTVGFQNRGNYMTSTTNQWLNANVLMSADSVTWGAAANNFIAITDLQLEAGTVCTPFERRPMPLELTLCQRYFCKSYDMGTFAGAAVNVGAVFYSMVNTTQAYQAVATLNWPVQMRSQPVVNVYGSSGAQGKTTCSGQGDFAVGDVNTCARGTTIRFIGAIPPAAVDCYTHYTAHADF